MNEKELMILVLNEEMCLKVGTPDFLKRHNEIMEEIERIKNTNTNIGECDERTK